MIQVIVGVLLILAMFATFAYLMSIEIGWHSTLLIWTAAFAVLGVTLVAATLIGNGLT